MRGIRGFRLPVICPSAFFEALKICYSTISYYYNNAHIARIGVTSTLAEASLVKNNFQNIIIGLKIKGV